MVENLFAKIVRAVKLPVLKEQKSPLEERNNIGGGGRCYNGFFHGYLWHVSFDDLLDPPCQVLHKSELGHILRLQVRKLFRQIVRIHVSVCRDQRFLSAVLNQGKITAPFIFHPNSIEMLRFRTENDHNLCRIECCEYVRLIFLTEPVFKGDPRKENLKAFTCQFVIQFGGKHAVLRSSATHVGFFIADEHIKRFFLLRYGKDIFLNFVDCIGFRLIYLTLIAVCILQGRFIVLIVKYRSILRTIDRGNTFMCGRVFHIFNAITAQEDRPIAFCIGVILIEYLLINRHSLVEIVVPTEVVSSVIKIGFSLIIELGNSLLCAAVFACRNRLRAVYFKRSAANFTLKYSHDVLPYLLSVTSIFSME